MWEFYGERRCIQTYSGHAQGVRDVSFNCDGTEFLSASFDRFIKLWDVETGKVKAKFTNKKVPYCVVFNPDEDKRNFFVTGTSDKKILCVSIYLMWYGIRILSLLYSKIELKLATLLSW